MANDTGAKSNAPDSARDGLSIWLMAAIVLTVAYVGLLAFVVLPENACAPPSADLCGLVGRLFRLSLNELGDFLAGAFAPLAFLWLAAAVGIQAQELAAQRRELRLTRKEFELNRSIAVETRSEIAQQASAARENAAFVGVQTNILQHQFDAQKIRAEDDEFERLLDQLDAMLRARIFHKAYFRSVKTGNIEGWLLATGGLPAEWGNALPMMTHHMLDTIGNFLSQVKAGKTRLTADDDFALGDLKTS